MKPRVFDGHHIGIFITTRRKGFRIFEPKGAERGKMGPFGVYVHDSTVTTKSQSFTTYQRAQDTTVSLAAELTYGLQHGSLAPI